MCLHRPISIWESDWHHATSAELNRCHSIRLSTQDGGATESANGFSLSTAAFTRVVTPLVRFVMESPFAVTCRIWLAPTTVDSVPSRLADSPQWVNRS